MKFSDKNLVSMTEANQNFSKVARLVDETGAAVILKNNTPKYVILEFNQFTDEEYDDDLNVEEIGKKLISQHIEAFKELAK